MSSFVAGADAWTVAEDADRRFRRITLLVAIPALILALIVQFLELTGEERGGGRVTETRYVSLTPEAEEAEAVEEPKPAEEDQPKPPQEEAKAQKPVEKPQDAPKQPTQAEREQAARSVAEKTGVMAFADQLAEMRDSSLAGFDASRPLSSEVVTAKSGTGAGGGTAGDSFASSAASGSGGIGATGTADSRRQQSGAGLGQRRTTTVQSPVGFGRDLSKPGQGGDKPLSGRSMEEIQEVMDRNQGSLYETYRRALLQNPSLGGTVKLRITIEPSGVVSKCEIVSSELGDADLERKVVLKVMSYRFKPKSVPSFTVTEYPIKFVPPSG